MIMVGTIRREEPWSPHGTRRWRASLRAQVRDGGVGVAPAVPPISAPAARVQRSAL